MKKLISFFLIIVFLCIFFFSQNNVIQISKYELTSDKISTDLKILLISDLHSKSFGNNQEKLVEKIKNINPDFIVFTGDSFDANRSTSQKDL